MFHHPEQIAASFGSDVKVTSLSGWRTTMKTSFLVSVGTAIGLLAATAAVASTVTTEHGRPLLVETEVSAATCDDVAVMTGTDAQSWQDALADKRAHDRVVQASWNNALADKRAQDRAVILASTGSATDCALTN
jgi:trans-2-enoyl-CoA reductase